MKTPCLIRSKRIAPVLRSLFAICLLSLCSCHSTPSQVFGLQEPAPSSGDETQGTDHVLTAFEQDKGMNPAEPAPFDFPPVDPLGENPHAETERLNDGPIAWWDAYVRNAIRETGRHVPVTLDTLLVRALRHSSQIRVFSELPLIRETAIDEADAAFDWSTFLDTRWDAASDPVGNTLTVGPNGGSRFRDRNLSNSGGLRRRTRSGGEFEIAQEFGWQDNNSQFFQPAPQGTSRLTLSYTRPLLRGQGEVYNESLIVLAQIDTEVARGGFSQQLQAHLLEVAEAYWELYQERAVFEQKTESYLRAKEIYQRLEHRRQLDAVASQLVIAEATLVTRQAELFRAKAAVKNAEARIRFLVNDPELGTNEMTELVPLDMPTGMNIPLDMMHAVQTAMVSRPEIDQVVNQMKAAAVRLDMSKNEMLPMLNLVTETYVAGLQDNGDMATAWRDMYTEGEPGYAVGLQFEMPLGRRAASARLTRRELELRQIQAQYRTTLHALQLEVEVAVREVETSHKEMEAKQRALEANQAQLNYLQARWEKLPGEDGSTSLVLQNLLDAQTRLNLAEEGYLKSCVAYNVALMSVKRATGTLLQEEQVTIHRAYAECLPTLLVTRPEMILNLDQAEQPPALVPVSPGPPLYPPAIHDNRTAGDPPGH